LPGIPNDGAYDGTFQVLLYTEQRLPSYFENSEIYIETILKKKNHRVYVSKYMYMQYYKEESTYFHSSFGSQYKLGNLHVASVTEFVRFSRKNNFQDFPSTKIDFSRILNVTFTLSLHKLNVNSFYCCFYISY